MIVALGKQAAGHKAYPDEKGTERRYANLQGANFFGGHKAYPDEKGTERSDS